MHSQSKLHLPTSLAQQWKLIGSVERNTYKYLGLIHPPLSHRYHHRNMYIPAMFPASELHLIVRLANWDVMHDINGTVLVFLVA